MTYRSPLAVILLLLAFAAGPAEAQYRTFGAGSSAGGTYVTDLNSDATDAREIAPGVGLVVGMHADRWFGEEHRTGVRLQASYQQPRFDWTDQERHINTTSADISLLVRVTEPEEGATVPYLAAGFGGIWYGLGRGGAIDDPEADARYDGDSRLQPTGVVALGVDIPIAWEWHRLPVHLRLEAADHITLRSPLRRIADDERHGMVHHIRFTIGAYSTFRRR